MRKGISLLLLGALLLPVMTGCTARAEKRTGEAEGYGGTLKVSVTIDGRDITDVKVTAHQETQGVGTRAIDTLPGAIAEADSIDVDSVSGATVTSQAIKAAVSQALGLDGMIQEVIPMNPGEAVPAPEMTSLQGVGMAASGRIGPGKDEEGGQVYSYNVVFAAGEFEEDGAIRAMQVDQLEVVTPNLGGGSAFSGFPASVADEERFLREVEGWTTKGAMGDEYQLASGSWREQMDAWQQAMQGKTPAELRQWYQASRGEGGEGVSASPDAASGATIALEGEYGNILLAIERAWEDARRGAGVTDGAEATQSPEVPAETARPE